MLEPQIQLPAETTQSLHLDRDELISVSRDAIIQGSKSFSFASLFFEKREKEGAWLLYSWCRVCDDAVDQADSQESALRKLEWLEVESLRALHTDEPLRHPAFYGLRRLRTEYNLPPELPLDLLKGMRLDVEGFRPKTFDDLTMYCYHVAGVVGVMMCYIMNVRSDVAHMHAIAFGNALQLTNIIRDVREDWNMGRIYIPQDWLKEEGIDEANFDLAISQWPALARRLCRAADARYKFGREGLHFLPWRCRLACRIAGSVYQQIGKKAERLGINAWDERVVVPFTVKVVFALFETVSLGTAALGSWLRTKIQSQLR